MNVVLLVLINNTVLISKLEEISTQLGEPDCLLIDPYFVKVQEYAHQGISTTLEPWLSNYTYENRLKMHSDKILTITEPLADIKSKYLRLIGEVQETIDSDNVGIGETE